MAHLLVVIVDNIPYTTTMMPIVENLGQALPVALLRRSLALRACLEGNATLMGASANVVVANLAEGIGFPAGFRIFLRYGPVTTGLSLFIASACVCLRYL